MTMSAVPPTGRSFVILLACVALAACSGGGGGDGGDDGDGGSSDIGTTAYMSPSLAALPRLDVGAFVLAPSTAGADPTAALEARFGFAFAIERTLSGGALLVRAADRARGRPLDEETTVSIARDMGTMPEIRFAHPDFLHHPTAVPNDTHYPLQWHYPQIRLPEAWDATTGSSGVIVGVLDTGILSAHPDLSGSTVAGYDLISNALSARDGDGRDPNPEDEGDSLTDPSWHGTHVAGTVAAATNNASGVAGVAWQVKVEPVRVLGMMGATTSDLVDAIRWAAGGAVPGLPANPIPVQVINMSLGASATCEEMQGMQEAIDEAVSRGVTVVVAAGNEGANAREYAPASCAGVVSVAASNINGSLAYYSNWGLTVTIMAPGGDTRFDSNRDGYVDGVLSTLLVDGDEFGYAFYQGTSMASPHVAGVAALLLSVDPALTPSRVTEVLTQTAAPVTPVQCPPLTPCGAGLLDAAAALAAVGG